MPLKLDTPSMSEKAPLSTEGGGLTGTIQDLPNKGSPYPVIVPTLQAILVVIALCIHYLRIHHTFIFGVSLSGWPIPPECIVLLAPLVVLAVQQFGWEAELLKDTKPGKKW